MSSTPKPRLLSVYFILIFVTGVLLRLFVLPSLWPAAIEITDSAIALLVLFSVMLIVVYYLKTQGSKKQLRTIFALGIALPVGFLIYAVVSIVIRTLTETISQGWSEFIIILAIGYTIGFIIAVPASKKMLERYTRRF
jgi:membrane protease YdiL (CAAX protease family)